MLKNIPGHLRYPFWRKHRLFPVYGGNPLVRDVVSFLEGVHIVNPERKDVLIVDGIHNSVGVELVPECLLSGLQVQISARPCILCEYRGASEAEQIVFLEVLCDG